MKDVLVGTYYLGAVTQVDLFLREGTGGNFHCVPGNGKLGYIKIGADIKRWHEVVSTLVHEAMEMSYLLQGGRYEPDNAIANDSAAFLFVADHTKFTECCSMSGDFLAVAMPATGKAWKQWKSKNPGGKQ